MSLNAPRAPRQIAETLLGALLRCDPAWRNPQPMLLEHAGADVDVIIGTESIVIGFGRTGLPITHQVSLSHLWRPASTIETATIVASALVAYRLEEARHARN